MTNYRGALGARIFEAFLLLLLLAVTLKLTGDLPWSWAVILAPAWVPLLALILGAAGWIGAQCCGVDHRCFLPSPSRPCRGS